MVSKVIFFALAVLLVVQLAFASPESCTDPSAAKELVYKEEIRVEAPLSGRVAKEIAIPTNGKLPSCIIVTGIANAESQGAVSVSSIGLAKNGDVTIELVSTIQRGIDTILEVYTE